MKKVYKYITGDIIPEKAVYLYSTKNGILDKENGYQYVFHYFLVEVEED